MAALETVDILKRDNAGVLLSIIRDCGTLTVGKTSSGKEVQVKNVMRLKGASFVVTQYNFECIKQMLLRHCECVKGSPPEVLTQDDEWVKISFCHKDHRFVPKNTIKGAPKDKDKLFQQRQEIGLVETINAYNVTLKIPGFTNPLVGAIQAPDIGPHGKENLVDVVVWDMYNQKFNVSCKQTHAADLGGGGISGLLQSVPELVSTLYDQAITDLKAKGFEQGVQYNVNTIPQFQYKIPKQFTYKIFRGSEEVGGTIDYMYVGPADVVMVKEGLNGIFIPIEDFAAKKTYYFRLRKRDVFDNIVTVNYEKLNNKGLPVIFTSGPMSAPAARFVIEDRVLSTSIVRELHHDCREEETKHSTLG